MEASEGINCLAETILNKSWSCLNITDTFDCYPYNELIGVIAGIWCILNTVVGCLGNLLTIIAIPYAANRKLYDFIFKQITYLSSLYLVLLFL